MKQLITETLRRLRCGERTVLCTVLRVEGSSPRGPGARMAVFADGSALGTVGGGAVEQQAILYARQLLTQSCSDYREYLLYPNGGEDIGMVCGGRTLLGFACLLPDNVAQVQTLAALEAALAARRSVWLETTYAGGAAALRAIYEDLHAEQRLPRQPELRQTAEEIVFLEPFRCEERVFLFGGGHVGTALVPALAAIGFSVTVYDSRPDFAVPERYPAATNVVIGSFEDVLSRVSPGEQDYAIVMTPGHGADYTVLRQLLGLPLRYLGCIGSRKKVAFVNGLLREDGFSEADVARIHAPIGLPILAETPEEIAVSIAAQLILCRHGGE